MTEAAAAPTIKPGHRVRVIKPKSKLHGREGVVRENAHHIEKTWTVLLDGNGGKRIFDFLEAELVAIAATKAAS